MTPDPIDCQELVELVTAYLDDAVDENLRDRIAAHLEICPGCAEYVAQIKTTVRLSGSVIDDQLDPDFRDRLMAAFRDWK
ncbi:zf-HC2 domain-containing protein [Antrihabitans sp. YC2-6]|uniref:anti-sigma factor family protein n=1 Tax=Antrihabitans sp. YC2-6 TaxID=2799498 RepID=UPI0027DD03D8|nr:zf-HC2 domain-containing protein [Antrihabitans sp. YC2-6]